MATESLQSTLRSPSPSTLPSPSLRNNTVDVHIGSFVSLLSKYGRRYEGLLYHLNIQESTLGLRNVRCCGTEGRRKDGPQDPPCDKVFDYILFRGSDIKDLQLIPSPSAQSRQDTESEEDIYQSSYSRPDMISPLSRFDNSHGLGRGAQWVHTPALSCKSASASQYSPIPLSFQSPPGNAGPSMPMPSFVKRNRVAPIGVPQIRDKFASPIMGLVNDTSQIVPRQNCLASPQQIPTPPRLASYYIHSPLSNPKYQKCYYIAPEAVDEVVVYDSRFNYPNGSIPYEVPAMTSAAAPVNPGLFSNSHKSFSGMDPLLQYRQQMVNRGQEMCATNNPESLNVPSQSFATTNHASLLPPSISPHWSRIPSIDLNAEFDFEAMNEKFNKSEVWGCLGQRYQNDYREETAGAAMAETEQYAFDFKKCGFTEEEFLDIFGVEEQQHAQLPEHMRQESEVFGNNSQRPDQLEQCEGANFGAQPNNRGGGGYYNNDNNDYDVSNLGYGDYDNYMGCGDYDDSNSGYGDYSPHI